MLANKLLLLLIIFSSDETLIFSINLCIDSCHRLSSCPSIVTLLWFFGSQNFFHLLFIICLQFLHVFAQSEKVVNCRNKLARAQYHYHDAQPPIFRCCVVLSINAFVACKSDCLQFYMHCSALLKLKTLSQIPSHALLNLNCVLWHDQVYCEYKSELLKCFKNLLKFSCVSSKLSKWSKICVRQIILRVVCHRPITHQSWLVTDVHLHRDNKARFTIEIIVVIETVIRIYVVVVLDCRVYESLDLINSKKFNDSACKSSLRSKRHEVIVEVVEYEVTIVNLTIHNKKNLHAR